MRLIATTLAALALGGAGGATLRLHTGEQTWYHGVLCQATDEFNDGGGMFCGTSNARAYQVYLTRGKIVVLKDAKIIWRGR